ncbi:MAG: DUF1848 domain-containing protein [Rikenellaceae bacterium]
MAQEKVIITRDTGETTEASSPIIVSASRSTDIPAFYADWFLHRLKCGYSAWTNPFNGVRSFVSYENIRLIVFWSKNPKPLLREGGVIDFLLEKGINTYIQFTLNDYVNEGLEKGVPSVESRIETFIQLVERLGKGKVVWRFDPLILTDTIDVDLLIAKIKYIGDRLRGYTEKLVFSYADIVAYRKVANNLTKNNIAYREFTPDEMNDFAQKLSILNKTWGYDLATCGEKIELETYGISHNKCIDDDLMIKYFSNDVKLMNFIGVEVVKGDLFNPEITVVKKKSKKDKGQRLFCGCIMSKDIGEYNTCPHLCEYCYANNSKEIAKKNYENHINNMYSETITGR